VSFQVQRRGISGCVVLEDWTDSGPACDSLAAALEEAAREIAGGVAHAIRVLASDGAVTPVRGQRPTVLDTGETLFPEGEDE
jgi:hypothetical protein